MNIYVIISRPTCSAEGIFDSTILYIIVPDRNHSSWFDCFDNNS